MTQTTGNGKRSIWQSRQPERIQGYLFILPVLIFVIVFRVIPLINGVRYSFTNWTAGSTPVYAGLEQYSRLISDPVFLDTMRNAFFLLLSLPFWVGIPMLLAILIFLGVPGGQVFRVAYFFPVVLSTVIIGAIFNIVLQVSGPVNQVLELVGLTPVDWLGNENTALIAVIAVQIWATFGINVVIFLSGLSTVSQDIIDASRIDGASVLQTIRYVVIPSIRSTIEFAAVTSTVGMLTSMFGLIFVMTGGGPGTATYLPEYFIWLQQGRLNNPAYASAAGIVLFMFMAIVAFFQINIMSRNVEV